MVCMAMVLCVSCKKDDEYVDLGLPSGTLWATCNVGADSPEDYGDYFIWGETTTKSNYNLFTFKWLNSDKVFTKYNTDSDYGTVDNKTVLEPADDAAHVNSGGDWRMPTYDEMVELKNNCTWTWTMQGGKNGYRVTGSNGKSIFLPAAGGYMISCPDDISNDFSLVFADTLGCYWSSSLDTEDPIGAYSLNFDSDGVDVEESAPRCYGLSVRPVCVLEPVKVSKRRNNTQPSNFNCQNMTFTVNGISFEMVAVGGGTFTMGATSEQGSDAYKWEKPTHSVTLRDYYIGKFEVTQELWEAVMGSNPSHFDGSKNPVESVSWYEAVEFCNRLSERTGRRSYYSIDRSRNDSNNRNKNDKLKWTVSVNPNADGFRLPTEAEWEYAARGGSKSMGYKYSGSNNINDVARCDDNCVFGTCPVGTKSPNELGIYDMSGNVYEWCQDWYGRYGSRSQANPQGPSSGSYRILRGGSWGYDARDCRVSFRYDYNPDINPDNRGFRIAM